LLRPSTKFYLTIRLLHPYLAFLEDLAEASIEQMRGWKSGSSAADRYEGEQFTRRGYAAQAMAAERAYRYRT
jgi:hypothetical protein